MNLAIVNESTMFTGLGRYASYLAKATNATLFSLNLDSSINISKYPGKVVERKPFLKFGNGWYLNHRFPSFFLREIKDLIKNQITPETVIHYASQGIPHLNLDNRYIYTVHDLFGLDSKYNDDSRLRKLLKINFKHIVSAERIITVSQYVKSQLHSFGVSGKVNVVYPPVSVGFKKLDDISTVRKSLGLPKEKKLVLSVSSQDPRKNLKVVGKTMDLLGQDYALVRVGKPIGNCYAFNNIDDEK
ncbi:MAG: glycosyltransferase, partial [Thermoplasmatales archaeon]